jgi:hypothetical protein
MPRKSLAAMLAYAMLLEGAAIAQPAPTFNSRQVQISWEELSALAIDRRISTTLPDGTRLEGDALAVRPDTLLLDVHKTSNNRLYPQGQTEVPRRGVSEIRVIRYRGPVMRIILGIASGFGGAVGSFALGYALDSLAVFLPLVILGVPLAVVGGYYAGKLADRYTTRLLIQDAGQPHNGEEVCSEVR